MNALVKDLLFFVAIAIVILVAVPFTEREADPSVPPVESAQIVDNADSGLPMEDESLRPTL